MLAATSGSRITPSQGTRHSEKAIVDPEKETTVRFVLTSADLLAFHKGTTTVKRNRALATAAGSLRARVSRQQIALFVPSPNPSPDLLISD